MTKRALAQPRKRLVHAEAPIAIDPAAIALAGYVGLSTSAKVMTDRDLRILSCSRTWLELFGLEGRNMIGRSLHELQPDVRAHNKAVYDWTLAGNVGRGERLQMARSNGSLFWCDAELAAWRDAAGEVGGLVNSIYPISEAIASEDRQQRSQRRVELAARLASLHVWELDFSRGSLETSGSDADIFDHAFTYDELVAEPFGSCHASDREFLKAHLDADMAAGVPSPVEYRVHRDDGATVWVSAISELVFEQGKPARLVGVMQNVTQRKLAEIAMAAATEAAEAANRAKSAFLATVSHEIRTPLNGVLGMAQAMAADQLTPVQRERLEVISQSGQVLLAVLNDVLDLSKIEAGKLELDEAEFDLGELALGAHAAFAAVADQKGLAFSLAIDPAALGRYRGDAMRIRQVLHNLISNALKFTDAGYVDVEIGFAGEDLIIDVRDSGVGISSRAVGNLFQKFMQGDTSTTRRHGGTGLGLAICRELAQLMGGDIAVESRLGEGSAFRARLPLARLAPQREAGGVAAAQTAPLASERELRVLAAEDNKVNRLVLKTLLGQIGIDPVVVEDGLAAVEAWTGKDWDLILMDVQMPGLDGPGATREIRRREAAEGRARTPIIALTANALTHQRDEYLACGMDAVVSKPLEAAHLFATMSEVLDAGAAPAEAAA